jgi:GTP-binding protein
MTLEQAMEYISDDESVEVTPAAVRLRKNVLDQQTRGRLRSKTRNA